jgi:tRNA (mo5U34)-methyltransferase
MDDTDVMQDSGRSATPPPPFDLAAEVARRNWFHSIDFGSGVISEGHRPHHILMEEADFIFRDMQLGDSVLDVGAWDGGYSFEAKRRGAGRVLATDHYCWVGDGWGKKETFDFARATLRLDVEDAVMDVPELTVATVGRFDVVVFLGVFYHLRHPFLAMQNLSEIATKQLVVGTHLDALELERPAMVFYPGTELQGDPTNWWGPNPRCVLDMLSVLGFTHTEFMPHPHFVRVGLFRGTKGEL